MHVDVDVTVDVNEPPEWKGPTTSPITCRSTSTRDSNDFEMRWPSGSEPLFRHDFGGMLVARGLWAGARGSRCTRQGRKSYLGASAMAASVVTSNDAMLAAFWSARRVTLVGSRMPASTRSS